MDYEKLYKEALERAKGMYEQGMMPQRIEYIFPELKESEDERIRKEIINCVKNYGPATANPKLYKDMLSWLEKQGKNNMGISEATKKKLEDNLNNALEKETPDSWNKFLKNQGEQNPVWSEEDERYVKRIDSILYSIATIKGDLYEKLHIWLKSLKERIQPQPRQGEQKETLCDKCRKEQPSHPCQDITALGRCAIEHDQKPTNKIELKYKVGDWIVNKQGEIARINQVKKDSYGIQRYYIEFTNGAKTDPMPCFVDENSHFWTIQDAKDGDVLYSKSSLTGIEFIVMNRGINGYGHIDSYFRYNSGDGFGINIPSVFTAKAATPATKEQRDFLFQKMHEAGYEWDSEKKELKKIDIKK